MAGRFVASFKKSWQALYTLAGLDWGRAKGLTCVPPNNALTIRLQPILHGKEAGQSRCRLL